MKTPLKVRRKSKFSSGGAKYYVYGSDDEVLKNGTVLSHGKLGELLRERDVEFDMSKDGTTLGDLFLGIIHTSETCYKNHVGINRKLKGDIKFLNRVIRNGGLLTYAKELESRS